MEDSTVCSNGGGLLELTDDVHREIFLRLPTRCLCRARAVCRSWRDLASDPSFLRAYADRTAASPFLLTWSDTVTERDGTKDCTVHLSIHRSRPRGGDNDGRHGRPASSRCCDLCLVLTARHPSISGAMRSWDGILCVEMWVRPPPASSVEHHVPCSYLLLNPISMACTAVSAPALRGGGGEGKPGPASRSDRGYIAGAYSHPATGVYHLLHSSGSVLAGVGEQTPRFRLLTVDAPGAAWREIPISADADTAWLQTVVGRLRLQSSATAHGRLHWRVARSQTKRWHGTENLLVFDSMKEEFGCMALPQLQLHLHGNGEATVVKQRAISTLAGKLCLLVGVAATTVAVWVLEDYEAQDWRLRHMVDVAADSPSPSPLHWDNSRLDSVLGNVGLLVGGVGGDEVEEIIFYNCAKKVYSVRPWSWIGGSRPTFFGHRQGLAVHMQSLLPHNVIFGTMPRVQGVAFLDCPQRKWLNDGDAGAATCRAGPRGGAANTTTGA